MDWQRIRERLGEGWPRVRSAITLRRTAIVVGVLSIIGFGVITSEAVMRARLESPMSRVPSTIYTRPVAWTEGSDGSDGGVSDTGNAAVAIGTLDGAPMEERIPVTLRNVPRSLIQAILAVEDQRFYQHHGLDLKRIAGAMVADIRTHSIAQGGSTLTQQLVKNLFLTANRTPLRKVREAAMAVVLEMRYSKAQILEAYLNEIYLGQDGPRAIHGFGAAARYYFAKDVRRLSLAESAQLAAMISAPNRNVAARHPEAALARRDMVLQLMADQHRISAAAAAQAERIRINPGEHPLPAVDGRYFRDYVVGQVPGRVAPRGMAVYTTLDVTLQRAAERSVARGVARLSHHGAEAALVAIDPRTGEVLAMVGGDDYGQSQFNRATDAHRQPGSAFKPIVALAALAPHDGQSPQFTLASSVQDAPLRVSTPSGPWEPVDYDHSFRGNVTVRQAMEQSLNVPFARIGLAVGPDRIVDAAKRVGITSPLHAVPSIALGSSEVTLLELTRAYGVLATEGKLVPTRSVIGAARLGSIVSDDSLPTGTQVVDSAVAYLVTSALEGVVQHGTARALAQDGRVGTIAGKTGTSSDWRDAWFVAYSPSLVVGVWVGFDDGESLGQTGAAAALPVAASFLDQVAPDGGWGPFDVPPGITEAYAGSGDDSSDSCGAREVFLAGTEPPQVDCRPDDFPIWHDLRDWGATVGKQASRSLERLIAGLLGHGAVLR
ncbi:MAG TPA: transglycosylase domain-containing protein [Gemmatimonadales bacterium]|jgi:penicillin-binding protein 1B